MDSENQNDGIHRGDFGTCCVDLQQCLEQPNCLFHVSEDGSFYLAIAFIQTEEGTGWFDQAVLYCPFCGKQLQDRQELADKAKK
jgi:hypothetical protein